MTLMPVPAPRAAEIDFVPQAILKRPLSYFADRMDVPFARGHDDLDEYEGAVFSMQGTIFALRRYKGHPEGMVTVYLPRKFSDIGIITDIVSHILDELPVSRSDLWWQRADDPEL